MKFIVYRSEWKRGQGGQGGQGPNPTRLLLTDGTKCIFGFIGQQCGVADAALRGKRTVDDLDKADREMFPAWMRDVLADEPQACQAYHTNDDATISDEQRESYLKELFASEGDELEFVG